MNRHDTLPAAFATHGVFSTLNEPLSEGMLVVAVDVVAVEDVVVVAGVLVVVVVATEVVVVTRSGPVPLPQPAAASPIAVISATRRYARNANLWMLDSAITVPSRSSGAYCSKCSRS
jgi:hypothetical protein